jgi:probable HAF family extracellular repeat protein
MRKMVSAISLLPKGVAVLVGLAVIAPIGYAQSVTRVGGSVIVTERSALGRRLGHDVATNSTSIVTLDTPGGAVTQRASGGAGESPSSARDVVTTTQKYFITAIGTLGGAQSFAYAINDSGEVVGESWITGDASSHSFLYSNGKTTDLYPLNSQGVKTVGPTSINNAGQIASGVIFNDVYTPAISNSRTGNLSLIGSLGGVTSYGFNGVATSINNIGKVVGYSHIDSINRHAFLYSNGVISDIGSFGGYSAALSINDAGVIVGFASDRDNGSAHAFVYANGVMTDIHPATESYARDVNNHGQVVGEFLTADQSAFHAFVYSQGTFTDIGFAGSAETVAFAINDLSQIVGITYFANKQHAFIYENGKLFDLNSLIQRGSNWELSWAFDINNYGQIVGYGLLNDKFRAFVLTPAISAEQCKTDGWKNFGFKNEGLCIQFVNTGQ